jgi:hypothetical protein
MMKRIIALFAVSMFLACGHGPSTIEEGQTQGAVRGHGSAGDPTKPPETEDGGAEVENEDGGVEVENEDGGVEVENEDGGGHSGRH